MLDYQPKVSHNPKPYRPYRPHRPHRPHRRPDWLVGVLEALMVAGMLSMVVVLWTWSVVLGS